METTTPTRQATRSKAARDQIVSAALTVFALKGYTSASMDDVCLAAGCSKGGLYHHFRSKAAVLSGVVERLAAAGALVPPFEVADGALSVSSTVVGRMLIEVWAEASRNELLRTQLRAGYEAYLEGSLQHSSAPVGDILRIGALIQLLTRGERLDADEAARRLGLEHAA